MLPSLLRETRTVHADDSGNTDCKMYYNLTKHVYRYMGQPDGSLYNMHTVDERATVESHIAMVSTLCTPLTR